MSCIKIIDTNELCANKHYDLEAPCCGLFEIIGVFQHSIGGTNGYRWIARPICQLSISPIGLQLKTFTGKSTCSVRNVKSLSSRDTGLI